MVDGETGYLVPFAEDAATGFPMDAEQFAKDLGAKVTDLLGNPQKCKQFGQAGRRRVEETFSWTAIADQTIALYRNLTTDFKRNKA